MALSLVRAMRPAVIVPLLCALLAAGCAGGGRSASVPVSTVSAAQPPGFTPAAHSLAIPPPPPNFIPARPSGVRTSGRSPSALSAAFFAGQASLGNGVYYLAFPNGTPFGYYSYLPDPNYIYHFDLGYEYVYDPNDGIGSVYFYDYTSGHWWYTGRQYPFPYIYDFSVGLLFYYPDIHNSGHYTTNPRYFYNFTDGKIITLDSQQCPGLAYDNATGAYTATLVFNAPNTSCGGVGAFAFQDSNGQYLSGTVSHTIVDPSLVSVSPSLNGTLKSAGNPGTFFKYTALASGSTKINVLFTVNNANGTTSTYNGVITIQNNF